MLAVQPLVAGLYPSFLAHEPGLARSPVQQVDRLLARRDLVDALADVDGYAWHHAAERAGPSAFSQAMDMAAEHPLDLTMAANHVGQGRCLIGPAVAADIMVVDVERWMMDE